MPFLLSLLVCVSAACKEPAQTTKEKKKQPAAKTKVADKGKAKAKVPQKDMDSAVDQAVHLGDLDEIKQRGTLRILIRGKQEGFLPRQGMPELQDIELAEQFAIGAGLKARFVLVDQYEQLIPMLVEGKGDLIAAQLTITDERKKKVAFGRSTVATSEILVGKKGAVNPPKKAEELNEHKVFVRASSSYAETLKKIKEKEATKLEIVNVPEQEDAESIVYSVSTGERELTVVDSHLLKAIETYNKNFERLFPLAEDRQIAWAVRQENPKLRAAVDAFVIEKAMTGHTEEKYSVDLEGIKKRGVLRVLTRNNSVTYFLYKGRQFGFNYDLAKLIAEDLKVRLDMVIPPSRDQLVPWLKEGRADMIAASMTVTPERAKDVSFSRAYFFVDEVLVRKKGAAKPNTKEELAGMEVHVRESSSYYNTLVELQKKVKGLKIVKVKEGVETEELIGMVASGKIPLTVADSHILDIELTYGTEVEAALPLTELKKVEGIDDGRKKGDTGAKSIAFAVRKDNPELKGYLDLWAKKNYRGLKYNMLKNRYFKNARKISSFKKAKTNETGQISPYDKVIKKYSTKYGLDWRLMAAQSYVESHFDPNAKSWVGALGLFQVMPRTGESLGFTNLPNPDQGVHAGIKYMSRLISRFDPNLPFKQRVRFAMASYNAGLGHVLDARRLAKAKGWDHNRWFGNVEKAMLLLAKPEYAKQARHGYCRGGEPVKYVSHIQTLYEAYIKAAPQ